MRVRKKPVEVEAVQWIHGNYNEIIEFMGSKPERIDGCLIIETLEGNHRADEGDWIIKGVHGEFYPCKPEIFNKTYDILE